MHTDSNLAVIDAEEQRGLAVFWQYLSQVFMDIPDHSIIERTRELLPFIQEMGKINSNASRAAEKLTNFLNEYADLEKNVSDERLNISYTFLFYLDAPIPASESAWLSPDGLIMQEQWEQVMLTYKAHDFSKPEGYIEPEDHIGLEFLFMAALSGTVADLLNNKPQDYERQTQNLMASKKRFLDRHLGKWIAPFAHRVIEKGKDTFSLYTGASLLAFALSELEKTW